MQMVAPLLMGLLQVVALVGGQLLLPLLVGKGLQLIVAVLLLVMLM
jgi:hypothetical protein